MEATKALTRLPKEHQGMFVEVTGDLLPLFQTLALRDRFIGVIATQIQNAPTILNANPDSLKAAIVRMAQLRLDPTISNHCHLVVYNGRVQFQTGYAGKIELAMRHPDVLDVYANMVMEGETFIYRGPYEKPDHQFASNPFSSQREQKDAIGFYAVAKLRGKDGQPRWRCLIMSREDVRAHARRYSRSYYIQQSKITRREPKEWNDPVTDKPMNSFWRDNSAKGNFNEMGLVSVIRLLCDPKQGVPLTAEVADQFRLEDAMSGLTKGTDVEDGQIVHSEPLNGEALQTKARQNIGDLFGDEVNPTAHKPQPVVAEADVVGDEAAVDIEPTDDPPITYEGEELVTQVRNTWRAMAKCQAEGARGWTASLKSLLTRLDEGSLEADEVEAMNDELRAAQEFLMEQMEA